MEHKSSPMYLMTSSVGMKVAPSLPLFCGDRACSPVRRKTKSAQCILSKKVVAVSDYHPPRTEELPSHQRDLIQVFCKNEGGQDFSHLQNGQQAFFSSPTRCTATYTGISKQRSFSCSNNQSDAKTLQPPASPKSNHHAKWIATAEPAAKNSIFSEQHGSLSRKNTEDNISAVQGNEASLPLTGSTLYGTPSLLRKIWMKHKKKSEYLGATNGAFEAD
ncbi:LOW QUALITY PROTEIN: vexin [Sceloporus undulatus]|uniref:LOW QUALITY PROTEIN: vexin n=1 Tax=Sceloporus undulatus TaxID=8520 RepID=UPI001C4D20BF|nr:LOW QUALITY PROTEIN: vexin [Sceloporus undulatus]